MKLIFLAFAMTISSWSHADSINPQCSNALASKPFCISKLNSQLYCAQWWYLSHPEQVLAGCYSRMKDRGFSTLQLQSICVGDIAVSTTEEMNKSLCDE
jgi:hypothetical protein